MHLWLSNWHVSPHYQVEICAGDVIQFTTNEERMNTGDGSCVYVDYTNFPRVLRPGRYVKAAPELPVSFNTLNRVCHFVS